MLQKPMSTLTMAIKYIRLKERKFERRENTIIVTSLEDNTNIKDVNKKHST